MKRSHRRNFLPFAGYYSFFILFFISSCGNLTWTTDCNRLLTVYNEIIRDEINLSSKNSSISSEIGPQWIQSTYELANAYERAAEKFASIQLSDQQPKDIQKHQILFFQKSANYLRELARFYETFPKNPTQQEMRKERDFQEARTKQFYEIKKEDRAIKIMRYCKVFSSIK